MLQSKRLPFNLFLCLFLSLGGPVSAYGQSGTIKLASDIYPPFTNTEGKKAISLALISKALEPTSYRINPIFIDFENVITGLQTGTYDGGAAIWKTQERTSFLVYSQPYLENKLILVGRKGNTVEIPSIEQLPPMKIGIVKDYAYGEELFTFEGPHWVKGENDQENLILLLEGKLDYILADQLLIRYLTTNMARDLFDQLEIASNPLIIRRVHFVLRKNFPKARKIISDFNRNIQAMKSDGTYNEILNLDWIFADIDMDGQSEYILRGSAAGTAPPTNVYEILSPMPPIKTSSPRPSSISTTKKARGSSSPFKTPRESGSKNGPPSQRFVIEGKVYSSWDEIPDKYKVKVESKKN